MLPNHEAASPYESASTYSDWPDKDATQDEASQNESASQDDTGWDTEQIKRGSTGSMLQEHFMISGTFESETHTNKQPDLIIKKIYEYH